MNSLYSTNTLILERISKKRIERSATKKAKPVKIVKIRISKKRIEREVNSLPIEETLRKLGNLKEENRKLTHCRASRS